MVTGESLPVEKLPGSSVIAGSLNGSGVTIARLTHLPGHNTISTIAAMVDEAKFSKPKNPRTGGHYRKLFCARHPNPYNHNLRNLDCHWYLRATSKWRPRSGERNHIRDLGP